jgi:hypothetical protein
MAIASETYQEIGRHMERWSIAGSTTIAFIGGDGGDR